MFNSDIICGRYEKEINLKFVSKLAQALFSLYQDQHLNFVIGKDTKLENFEIEKTLAKELSALGANVFLLGTTSTGGISFATKAYKATAGIMITGSSKPNKFVGFKIFNGNGYKISDEQIESLKYKFKNITQLNLKNTLGKVYFKPYFNFEYINFLKQFSKINKTNSIKVLADLSLGSGEEIYEDFAQNLGIKAFVAYKQNSPKNINKSFLKAKISEITKSFKTQDYFEKIKNHKNFFDFKVVFDADCDKLVLFDKNGKKISDEQLLMLFALEKKINNGNVKVVVGNFVNSKIFDFFKKYDITYFIEDNFLKQKLLIHRAIKEEADLAGDSFGNIVFLNKTKTADAFLTLIKLLNIYSTNFSLYEKVLNFELNKKYIKKFKLKKDFNLKSFKKIIFDCETSLAEQGKILFCLDKFSKSLTVHLETNNQNLKNEIFNHIENFFKKIS